MQFHFGFSQNVVFVVSGFEGKASKVGALLLRVCPARAMLNQVDLITLLLTNVPLTTPYLYCWAAYGPI